MHINKNNICIKPYDAKGKWEKESELLLTEIFKVQFDDPYTRYFNAYMKNVPYQS